MDDQGSRWNGKAGFCRVSMRLLDLVGRSGKVTWCPGPDSNRYGVSPEGFSYPLQLSLLHASHKRAFGVWTLPSPWPAHDQVRALQAGAVKSLHFHHTLFKGTALSSVLQPP